jgi:tetratricopeptide (TPR) repeat protein
MEARDEGVRDPWQEDVLDELVAYLQAARDARATAWAVVVTSSEALEEEVLAAFDARMGDLWLVDASAGEDPRRIVEVVLATPKGEGFRTNVLLGLSSVLASDARDAFLSWMNFHREDFERPTEAFIFMLRSEQLNVWRRLAPDLDRYTQHFDFVDWNDLVAEAEGIARTTVAVADGLSNDVLLEQAERWLESSRSLQEDVTIDLINVGEHALALGQLQRASEALSEALSLTEGKSDNMRLHAMARHAFLLAHLGCPHDALLDLGKVKGESDPNFFEHAVGVVSFYAGQPRVALLAHERSLVSAVGHRFVVSSINAAEVEQWLGFARAALGRIRGVFRAPPLQVEDEAFALGCLAWLLIDIGELTSALVPMMKSLFLSQALRRELARVAGLISLARATFDVGRLARCLEIVDIASSSAGWKSAMSIGLAAMRADVLWMSAGPAAVSSVVRDERERQRGWRAPIAAAELAYARALASMDDDDARRCLQDAADRFRAMDGWYYLSELERRLARLDRLEGDAERAAARVREGLEWHAREGVRPREACDRTELAMIALGRGDAGDAIESANQALELIRACGTRLYEPAALVALAAAERALGNHEVADAHDHRWRRLVRGIGAKGLEAALERDAAWARDVTAR